MTFHKKLYVGKTIKDPAKVKRKLKRNAWQPGVFVVALAQGSDQLEYYNSTLLKQKLLRQLAPPYVVGFAGSEDEAQRIVERLATECYEQTGNVYIKDYLLGNSGE
jgi:hypothetical protein